MTSENTRLENIFMNSILTAINNTITLETDCIDCKEQHVQPSCRRCGCDKIVCFKRHASYKGGPYALKCFFRHYIECPLARKLFYEMTNKQSISIDGYEETPDGAWIPKHQHQHQRYLPDDILNVSDCVLQCQNNGCLRNVYVTKYYGYRSSFMCPVCLNFAPLTTKRPFYQKCWTCCIECNVIFQIKQQYNGNSPKCPNCLIRY